MSAAVKLDEPSPFNPPPRARTLRIVAKGKVHHDALERLRPRRPPPAEEPAPSPPTSLERWATLHNMIAESDDAEIRRVLRLTANRACELVDRGWSEERHRVSVELAKAAVSINKAVDADVRKGVLDKANAAGERTARLEESRKATFERSEGRQRERQRVAVALANAARAIGEPVADGVVLEPTGKAKSLTTEAKRLRQVVVARHLRTADSAIDAARKILTEVVASLPTFPRIAALLPDVRALEQVDERDLVRKVADLVRDRAFRAAWAASERGDHARLQRHFASIDDRKAEPILIASLRAAGMTKANADRLFAAERQARSRKARSSAARQAQRDK